jgi:exonuclease III
VRLLTWNCYRGTIYDRLELLRPLRPDLAVLQECSAPELLDGAIWCGPNRLQGVAISAPNPAYRVQRIDDRAYPNGPGVIARVEGPDCFLLAGVWTRGRNARSYVDHAVQWLLHHRAAVGSEPFVVAGDVNSAPARKNGPDPHRELLRVLQEEFGLVSAYHHFHGVEHGHEPHPTHYWRRSEASPWHIDYCFIPESWASRVGSVEVGSYSEWPMSDHRPLTVELHLG